MPKNDGYKIGMKNVSNCGFRVGGPDDDNPLGNGELTKWIKKGVHVDKGIAGGDTVKVVSKSDGTCNGPNT
jgi:hypothetical protein